MGVGAGYGDGSGLDWLTQGLEHAAVKLRQLIEEKHAQMRKCDFSGLGLAATTHQSRQARLVVRVAVGAGSDQSVLSERPGERVHHGDGKCFLRMQRREQARQARG